MNSVPELFVVRIYKQQKIVGAGFLISDEYILTCAHVIADKDSPEIKPTQEIELDFPIIKPGKILKAAVEFWLPVNPKDSPEDIAVLKLIKPKPVQAVPAYLFHTSERVLISGHNFDACGFPEDGEETGIWIKGYISRKVSGGWIQLVGTNIGIDKKKVFYLEKGFSGTPIWVEDLGVVGMAVAVNTQRPEAQIAFMIPTELLFKAWDKSLEICLFDSRISSLIGLIEPYFKDFKHQIEIAYKKSLPQLSIGNFPDTITEIVRSLDTRQNDSENNYSCLENFVGYLLLDLEEKSLELGLCDSLREWLNKYLENYQGLINSFQEKQQQEKEKAELSLVREKPCLLIAVLEDNNSFVVQAWLIKHANSYKSINGDGCYPLTDEKDRITTDKKLSNLRETINSLIDKCIYNTLQDVQKIQFFLPPKLIINNLEFIDSIILDPGGYCKQAICTEYELSIRLSPRLGGAGKRYIARWLKKGKLLNEEKDNHALDVFKNKSFSAFQEFRHELNKNNVVAVRLKNAIKDSQLELVIGAFLEIGIPLALWMRKDIDGINCSQALESLCENCRLEELSERIKYERSEAASDNTHLGNCLSLLWDDPALVPPEYAPEYVLKMP